MAPTIQEKSLIGVVRVLPETDVAKILIWVQQLGNKAGGRQIEWPDTWTDEDVADVTLSALQRFDQQGSKQQ